MTPREAFKLGFLQKCAADGLTDDETLERIRHAKFMAATALGEKMSSWSDALTLPALGLMAGPPLLGVGAGALLSDATSHNYSTDEAKKREELAEYQRALKAMQALHVKQNPVEVA